jgi:hypothetical protein
MPRNQLKSFPTAILRRGMVHFHPAGPGSGSNLAAASADNLDIPTVTSSPSTTVDEARPGRENLTT